MKPMEETTTASQAYGKPLETPVSYTFKWSNYEDHDEVVEAKDELSKDEVVDVRNGERKAKARQAALVLALDAAGIKKPDLKTDKMLRLKTVYNVLVAAGKSEAEAKAMAEATLGEKWDDAK